MPWEAEPAAPAVSTELETHVARLTRDFAYAVANTAIFVHSNNPTFVMMANSPRGHLVPRGEVRFKDGTTVELQDIGMCQPGNVPHMTVQEIMSLIWEKARELGLELAP